MDISIVNNALSLSVQIMTPVLGAILGGALVMGMVRAATAIDDEVLAFAGKLTALSVVLYLASGRLWQLLIEFTQRVWGGTDFYL